MSKGDQNGSIQDQRNSLDDVQEDDQPSNRLRAQSSTYTPDYEMPPSRRPAAERANSFNYLAWIVDGATGLIEEVRHNDLGLSQDFWVHFYAARREGLLAVRAVLNQLIEHREEATAKQTEQEKRRARRGNVDIQF